MKLYDASGRRFLNQNSHAVYADVENSLPVIDIHRESKKSGKLSLTKAGFDVSLDMLDGSMGESFAMQRGEQNIDITEGDSGIQLDFNQWLPFAAPKYKISADIKDYLVVPVIAIPSDLPNRNRVAFPLKQLLAFNTDMGMQSYRTWVGKPTYSEHKNDVLEEAYGVIIDTSLVKMTTFGGGKIWKVLMLLAFDRSKYIERVAQIANGGVNSYSMGAWVEDYTCSVCGAEVGKCGHVAMKDSRSEMTEANGRLAFKNCEGIVGFECSVVDQPAWSTAISDKLMSVD